MPLYSVLLSLAHYSRPIGILIVAEIVIEEVETDLLLMTEETRNLLCLARNNYTKANAYSINDFLSGSYPRS